MAKRSGNQVKVTNVQSSVAVRLLPLFVLMVAGLAVFSPSAAVLLMIGMIPTLVIVFTSTGLYAGIKAQTVGLANLAGVFLALAGPSQQGNHAPLFDIYGLSMAFGGAALGYALIFGGPIIAAVVLQSFSQERLRQISKQRQVLIDQWGGEIVGPAGPADTKPDL